MAYSSLRTESVHAALAELFQHKRAVLNLQHTHRIGDWVRDAEAIVLQQISLSHSLAQQDPAHLVLLKLLHRQKAALDTIASSGAVRREQLDALLHAARKEAELLRSADVIGQTEPTVAHPYHDGDDATRLLDEFSARAGIIAASSWTRLSGQEHGVFCVRNIKPATRTLVPHGEPGTVRLEAMDAPLAQVCTKFKGDEQLAALTLTVPFGADTQGKTAITSVSYLGPRPLLDAVKSVLEKRPSLAASLIGPALGKLDAEHCAHLLDHVHKTGLRVL